MKFLVIEDESNIFRIIESYLVSTRNEVIWAEDGEIGLDLFYTANPDFVILDLMLPGVSGYEICEKIRLTSDIPIIMLTAKNDLDDKVKGLKMGADDYISKPFSPRELMARIESVLRRIPVKEANYMVDGIYVDDENRYVTVKGNPIELTVSEYEILKVFLKRPKKVFTREELINIVKGKDSFIVDRGIDVHIANLRKKMGCDSKNPEYIRTVWGVGYRL